MIIDFILGIIYNVFMHFVGGYDPLRFNIDSSVYESVHDFMAFIFFILPIQGFIPIIDTIFYIIVFRAIVSFIKTLWDLLPVV